MANLIYILAKLIQIIIAAVPTMLFLRAILSLFLNPEENKLLIFLAMITEPFIIPVRFLMVKFNILQNSPIDWAFVVTHVLFVILGSTLPLL